MTRLCSDRATLRSKFRLRRESIYRRLCIHLSLVIRAPIPFFSLLPPPPSFASIKRCRPRTSTLHPFRIEFNSLSFYPSPRSSIRTVTSITLLLTSQLRSRVCIDVRPDSYGPFNFINSLGGRKIRRVHECQLVSPTEITILSVITSTQWITLGPISILPLTFGAEQPRMQMAL